jgi:hypothetical protein
VTGARAEKSSTDRRRDPMSEPGEDSHPAEFDALFRTDAVERAAPAFDKILAGACCRTEA